ncbi:MAG: MerR family DNA-binding transcriptional regulator [Roseateles sp.]|uniref:MerR family DNA-binding transcriptional regulator n=1 Tax=Roseateles sp. TaxID=1971397 RepID=UPI00403536D9
MSCCPLVAPSSCLPAQPSAFTGGSAPTSTSHIDVCLCRKLHGGRLRSSALIRRDRVQLLPAGQGLRLQPLSWAHEQSAHTTDAARLALGARQAGCSVPTIRYYEEIGLLPPGPRTDAGRHVYGSRRSPPKLHPALPRLKRLEEPPYPALFALRAAVAVTCCVVQT